jgi:hypothetical protein
MILIGKRSVAAHIGKGHLASDLERLVWACRSTSPRAFQPIA